MGAPSVVVVRRTSLDCRRWGILPPVWPERNAAPAQLQYAPAHSLNRNFR